MKRILVEQVPKQMGQKVKVAGFVQVIRDQGKIKFLLLRDISGLIQIFIHQSKAQAFEAIKDLNLESVVEIIGLAKAEKQAPGGLEIEAEEIKVLSLALPELPIPVVEKGDDKEADMPKRFDWRFLDLRKPQKGLMMKVWTLMEQSFREYWLENGFIEIHSPKLMGAASESGAEVFEVRYFDRKAYLAQSPQFYKQMAMAAGLERVFEVGPVFRAEPSFTSRHMTEFTGYDMEISFIDSHQDIIQEEEKILSFVLGKIEKTYGAQILEAYGRELAVPKIPFPQMTMGEAKKALKKLKVSGDQDGDLNSEEEKKLSEYVKKEYGHEFVFVTDYPIDVRPFYHMRQEENPKATKSFDLLWSGIEVTTGAQREHRYDVLLDQAKEKKMKSESIQFYLDFFKYGCPPHGGAGIGPGRLMMKILNLESVKETAYLCRDVQRLNP